MEQFASVILVVAVIVALSIIVFIGSEMWERWVRPKKYLSIEDIQSRMTAEIYHQRKAGKTDEEIFADLNSRRKELMVSW